jgi:hypothetical protein
LKPLQKFTNNVKENFADYYTLVVIVVILPTIVGYITDVKWGFLLSFVIQAILGILYVKASNEGTNK